MNQKQECRKDILNALSLGPDSALPFVALEAIVNGCRDAGLRATLAELKSEGLVSEHPTGKFFKTR